MGSNASDIDLNSLAGMDKKALGIVLKDLGLKVSDFKDLDEAARIARITELVNAAKGLEEDAKGMPAAQNLETALTEAGVNEALASKDKALIKSVVTALGCTSSKELKAQMAGATVSPMATAAQAITVLRATDARMALLLEIAVNALFRSGGEEGSAQDATEESSEETSAEDSGDKVLTTINANMNALMSKETTEEAKAARKDAATAVKAALAEAGIEVGMKVGEIREAAQAYVQSKTTTEAEASPAEEVASTATNSESLELAYYVESDANGTFWNLVGGKKLSTLHKSLTKKVLESADFKWDGFAWYIEKGYEGALAEHAGIKITFKKVKKPSEEAPAAPAAPAAAPAAPADPAATTKPKQQPAKPSATPSAAVVQYWMTTTEDATFLCFVGGQNVFSAISPVLTKAKLKSFGLGWDGNDDLCWYCDQSIWEASQKSLVGVAPMTFKKLSAKPA